MVSILACMIVRVQYIYIAIWSIHVQRKGYVDTHFLRVSARVPVAWNTHFGC